MIKFVRVLSVVKRASVVTTLEIQCVKNTKVQGFYTSLLSHYFQMYGPAPDVTVTGMYSGALFTFSLNALTHCVVSGDSS